MATHLLLGAAHAHHAAAAGHVVGIPGSQGVPVLWLKAWRPGVVAAALSARACTLGAILPSSAVLSALKGRRGSLPGVAPGGLAGAGSGWALTCMRWQLVEGVQ